MLRQVWTGHGTANQLPEPRRERELREASLRGGAERGLVVVMLRAD